MAGEHELYRPGMARERRSDPGAVGRARAGLDDRQPTQSGAWRADRAGNPPAQPGTARGPYDHNRLETGTKNTQLRLALPYNVPDGEVTYEVPFGNVVFGRDEMPNTYRGDGARWVQKWLDVSNGDYGVTLGTEQLRARHQRHVRLPDAAPLRLFLRHAVLRIPEHWCARLPRYSGGRMTATGAARMRSASAGSTGTPCRPQSSPRPGPWSRSRAARS